LVDLKEERGGVAVPVKLQYDERQRVADETEDDNRSEQHHVDDERERFTVQLTISRPLHGCRLDDRPR